MCFANVKYLAERYNKKIPPSTWREVYKVVMVLPAGSGRYVPLPILPGVSRNKFGWCAYTDRQANWGYAYLMCGDALHTSVTNSSYMALPLMARYPRVVGRYKSQVACIFTQIKTTPVWESVRQLAIQQFKKVDPRFFLWIGCIQFEGWTIRRWYNYATRIWSKYLGIPTKVNEDGYLVEKVTP